HLLKYHTSKERTRYLLDILENDSKRQNSFHIGKSSVGKIVYLHVIFNSFIKDPRNIFKYLNEVLKELKSRLQKNTISKN
ncbi:MAG: hypothetical protein ACFFAO_11915, partial [Candidatus Hermodarchaeota archaeon]